jgi:hypothetical protein
LFGSASAIELNVQSEGSSMPPQYLKEDTV